MPLFGGGRKVVVSHGGAGNLQGAFFIVGLFMPVKEAMLPNNGQDGWHHELKIPLGAETQIVHIPGIGDAMWGHEREKGLIHRQRREIGEEGAGGRPLRQVSLEGRQLGQESADRGAKAEPPERIIYLFVRDRIEIGTEIGVELVGLSLMRPGIGDIPPTCDTPLDMRRQRDSRENARMQAVLQIAEPTSAGVEMPVLSTSFFYPF